jgi:sec-independent protein translocase protein TatA
MFGIGTTELIVVAVIALLLFGNRLPSVMRSLGQGVNEFKRGLNDVQQEIEKSTEEKPTIEESPKP